MPRGNPALSAGNRSGAHIDRSGRSSDVTSACSALLGRPTRAEGASADICSHPWVLSASLFLTT